MVKSIFDSPDQSTTPEPQQPEHQTPPPPADNEPLDEHTWRALFNGFEPHNFQSSAEDPSGSEGEERYLLLPVLSISKWKRDIFNILLIERVGKSNVASSRTDSEEGVAFWSVPTRCLRKDQFVDNPVIDGMVVDALMKLNL